MNHAFPHRFALLALMVGVAACSSGPDPVTPPDPPVIPGFEDHTVGHFATLAAFQEFADLGATPMQCKFVTDRFQEPTGHLWLMDPKFYQLHDEWYWFRMLNGVAVEGMDDYDPYPGEFDSIAAIYTAFKGKTALPLDLHWYQGGRLASGEFYNRALGLCHQGDKTVRCPRFFGVGSLLWLPAEPKRVVPEELWLMELELPDEPTEQDLLTFFARLEPTLPPEAQGKLRWLARTADKQEALAATLRAGSGPLSKRVVTYDDLVTPGEAVGYNPGITAGTIKRIKKGTLGKASVEPDNIVILEEVPDDIPPVAGIVTAVPQTPQAHFNLLAIARGTPNAYVGAVMDDVSLAGWAIEGQPVILQVTPKGVRWQPMTEDEWQLWKAKTGHAPLTITPVDVTNAPYFFELQSGGLKAMKATLPLIGGKCAGMMALLGFTEIPTPYKPVSLTIRAFAEHVAPFKATLKALLEDKDFDGDRRARFLLLEGEKAFRDAHEGDPAAMAWFDTFMPSNHSPAVANVLYQGGVRQMIEDRPIDPVTMGSIQATLADRYALLSHKQGLRFRSSSTAEDIEGFNGAGVYDSNTGYLFPEEQEGKNKNRSVEHAIKKTWSSYWTFAAAEERRIAGVPHLTGNMALLVEPNFQDDKEEANGVVLLGLVHGPKGDRVEMTVNVQLGALSVTNPPPGVDAEPEVDRLVQIDGGTPTIERIQASSEQAAPLLVDAELLALFAELEPVVDGWLEQANSTLDPAERATSLILDLEFRKVFAGWPLLSSGDELPGRIVIKQARTLSRPAHITKAELGGVRVPKDILAAASHVDQRVCTAGAFTFRALEVTTDPGATLLDYDMAPFEAMVQLDVPAPLPELGLEAGLRVALHTELTAMHDGTAHWDLTAILAPATALTWGLDTLSFDDGGAWKLVDGEKSVSGTDLACTVKAVALSPTAWLETLLK